MTLPPRLFCDTSFFYACFEPRVLIISGPKISPHRPPSPVLLFM